MSSGGRDDVTVTCRVLGPDEVQHGAHVFRRVGNSNRVVDRDAPRWVRGVYRCKECGGQLEDWEVYCPWCGRRLCGAETEEGGAYVKE